jgi:hypothetical protein
VHDYLGARGTQTPNFCKKYVLKVTVGFVQPPVSLDTLAAPVKLLCNTHNIAPCCVQVTHLHLNDKGLTTLVETDCSLHNCCPKLSTLYLYGNKLTSAKGLERLNEVWSIY